MQEIDLKKGQLARHVTRAVKAINDGYVIAVPMENAYAYICDAFNHDAVRAMHVLRGDELGVKAQVLVSNFKMAEGISRNLDKRTIAAMKKYWPGKVTFQVLPSALLNWDLGDGGSQGVFLARCSEAEVIRDIARKHGPILTATVALVGGSIARTLAELEPFRSHADLVIEAQGEFDANVLSTIVDVSSNPPTILRRGALSLLELASQAPSIRVAS